MSNISKLPTNKKETQDGLRGIVKLLEEKIENGDCVGLMIYGVAEDDTLFTVRFDCVRGDLVGYADQHLTGMKLMLCDFQQETAEYEPIPEVED